MSGKKSRYLFSPTSGFFQSAMTCVSVKKLTERRKEDHTNDIISRDSDVLSHSNMSWGSLEDRYILHETSSDDRPSTSSISLTSSPHSTSSYDQSVFFMNDEKRQFIMDSKWGGYGFDIQLWEDERAPVVKVREENETVFDELEYSGVVTDRLIGAGSSFLTKSPENGLYVLNKCIMRDMELRNITMLHFHRYLQYIDLSYNYISDLSPLSGIPYLMYLNTSNNSIKGGLNFTPPWYLTYVNLSFNHILEMGDFSSFWSIVRLDLSHNSIEVISGLQNLKYLQYLNLSYNLIECIENLDNLNIQELNLECNCITSFRSDTPDVGLSTLSNLRIIILGYNRLSSLGFFKDAYGLRLVDLKFNKINDLLEVSNFKGPIYEIDLRGNPCTKWPNYRDVLLFFLSSIVFIDGSEVSTTEKVSAMTIFASPLDLIAARTVTKLTLLEQLSVPKIDLHVRPYDELSPPLIILTGPSAVKKAALAIHVARILSKRVKYCRCHTTREMEEHESEDAYIFVSREEFNDITRHGNFLAVQELLGNSYGFHYEQITSLVTEKKIGITQMDLHATLQIYHRYPNIKPILVLTKSERVHREWIQKKFDVYTWIKDSVENLLAVKIGKRTDESFYESMDCKVTLAQEIIEEIMDTLESSPYCLFVRPRGIRMMILDTINEFKTTLPDVKITKSDRDVNEQKRTVFHSSEGEATTTNDGLQELRVILDEDSNIVIDEKAAKRRRYRAKLIRRLSTLEAGKSEATPDTEGLDESISSDETSTESKMFGSMKSPEHLKDMYTELVIQTRKIYLEYHRGKPGFFCLVLLTDDYLKAYKELIDFVHELYVSHSLRKPSFLPEMQHFNEVAIPEAANKIASEVKESLSTPILQRKTLLRTYGITSWKNIMPSQMTEST